MPDVLHLEDFHMTRLHVDWLEPKAKGKRPVSVQSQVSMNYDVMRRRTDKRLFALVLRFQFGPEKDQPQAGYAIDAEIAGLFRFPESLSEGDMQKLIRINGGMILYGILRGQIAGFTGSFPHGKFTLPAVYMPDVVATVESGKKASGTSQQRHASSTKASRTKRAVSRSAPTKH